MEKCTNTQPTTHPAPGTMCTLLSEIISRMYISIGVPIREYIHESMSAEISKLILVNLRFQTDLVFWRGEL